MANSQETSKWTGDSGVSERGFTESARRSTTDMIDKAAKTTSEGLLSAAAAVENAGQKSTEAVNEFVGSADKKIAAASDYADKTMTAASEYLERCDPQDMLNTMRDAVRRHPGRMVLMAAAIAGAFGFLAASRGRGRSDY